MNRREELNKRREQLKFDQEAKTNLEMVKKVLDALACKNINVEYDIKINKKHLGATLPYYYDIWVDVDVDKHYSKSPSYDQQYVDVMDGLEEKIENALRYVNLQNYFGGVIFDYQNDELIEFEINRLNERFKKYIQSQFPNVTDEDYIGADIYYYFYKSETDNPYMRVEFIGNPPFANDPETGEDYDVFSCNELYEMMNNFYFTSPLSSEFEFENFTCS
jgi:hypothetical protein